MIPGFVYRELTARLHRELCRVGTPFPHRTNPNASACVRAARIAAAVLEGDVEVAAVGGLVHAAKGVDRAWNTYVDSDTGCPVDVPAEAIGRLRAALFELGEL